MVTSEVLRSTCESLRVVNLTDTSPPPDASATADDPLPPTPQNADWSPTSPVHSNPHEQFHSKSNDPPPPTEISDLEAELSGETPPLGVSVESDGGDISGKSSTGN